jgi:hypothetical protein
MIFSVGDNSAGQCGTGAFKQWLIAMACYYPFRLPQSHLHYEKVINQQIFNGSRPKHNGFRVVPNKALSLSLSLSLSPSLWLGSSICVNSEI